MFAGQLTGDSRLEAILLADKCNSLQERLAAAINLLGQRCKRFKWIKQEVLANIEGNKRRRLDTDMRTCEKTIDELTESLEQEKKYMSAIIQTRDGKRTRKENEEANLRWANQEIEEMLCAAKTDALSIREEREVMAVNLKILRQGFAIRQRLSLAADISKSLDKAILLRAGLQSQVAEDKDFDEFLKRAEGYVQEGESSVQAIESELVESEAKTNVRILVRHYENSS